MSEQEEFLANFDRKRRKGLRDIKFCVEDGDSLQAEDFFSASNRLDRAIAEDRCVRLDFWNRDPKLETHGALT